MIEYPETYWKDYELVDSGDGEKLERYGSYYLSRPEPKALWAKTMSQGEWDRLTHTRFIPGAGFGKAGKEDSGSWERRRKMDDQWHIAYNNPSGLKMDLRLGLTSFKHVGVFPEQASNWNYIYDRVRRYDSAVEGVCDGSALGTRAIPAGSSPSARAASISYACCEHPRDLGNVRGGTACGGVGAADGSKGTSITDTKVLNLFAYTGAASLAAKAAGAEVTHLDSVRQVVTWARGNMESSGMDGIRWVVEDAMKFAKREARRGNLYDGIILDPPAYGHGPDGEKWKLDECLFDMLKTVSCILKPHNSFMVLNLYSNGFSAALGETVVREAFGLGGLPGPSSEGTPTAKRYKMESGELALRDRFGKVLPLSIVIRLELL